MSKHRRALALAGVVLLALAGVADGIYLSLVHIDLELGGGGIGRLCHALSRTGCEVTGGRYGALFGLPVALVGAAGALATLVVALLALARRRDDRHPSHAALVGLAAASVAASLLMALLSALEGGYCPFCVVWYGINALLLVLALVAARRPLAELAPAAVQSPASAPGLVALGVFAAGLGGGAHWYGGAFARSEAALDARVRHDLDAILARPPLRGLDLQGNPRRRVGGPGEPVTIVEFSDFECPYCRQLWDHTERYFAATARPLEVVFVNYPLDAACNPAARAGMHEHACLAALASECADRQGRFWDYADRVFEHQPDLARATLLGHADALGLDRVSFETCLDDPATRTAIDADLTLARAAGVTGTPTVVIGGYKITGVVRRPLLDALLDAIDRKR